MPKLPATKERVEHRHELFVDAYIANGGNATEAAMAVGYSPKTASSQGSRLLRNVKVWAEIVKRRADIAKRSGLEAEQVLREVARALHFDPRKLFNNDGRLIPVTKLDDDTALALTGIKLSAIKGSPGEGDTPDQMVELKWEAKATARDQACKILGLYERDNRQKGQAENIYRMSMEELEKIARGE